MKQAAGDLGKHRSKRGIRALRDSTSEKNLAEQNKHRYRTQRKTVKDTPDHVQSKIGRAIAKKLQDDQSC